MAQTKLNRDQHHQTTQQLVEERALPTHVVRMDDRIPEDVLADTVLRPITKHALHHQNLIEDRPIDREQANDVEQVLNKLTETLLHLTYFLLRTTTLILHDPTTSAQQPLI